MGDCAHGDRPAAATDHVRHNRRRKPRVLWSAGRIRLGANPLSSPKNPARLAVAGVDRRRLLPRHDFRSGLVLDSSDRSGLRRCSTAAATRARIPLRPAVDSVQRPGLGRGFLPESPYGSCPRISHQRSPSSSPAFWAIYFPGALTYSAATGCYLYFCSPQPTGASKHPSAINADEPKTVLT